VQDLKEQVLLDPNSNSSWRRCGLFDDAFTNSCYTVWNGVIIWKNK
jgi:hypothetical protein